jgi:hypothetical protein
MAKISPAMIALAIAGIGRVLQERTCAGCGKPITDVKDEWRSEKGNYFHGACIPKDSPKNDAAR